MLFYEQRNVRIILTESYTEALPFDDVNSLAKLFTPSSTVSRHSSGNPSVVRVLDLKS